MFYFFISGLNSVFYLLQPPAATEAGGGAGGAASAGSEPFGCAGGGMMTWGYIAAMIGIFWFLVISPQRKQQKAHEAMLTGLKKGDVVRTSGGVRGEVLSLDERAATLKIAEKTKINILRANIAGLDLTQESTAEKS